MLLLLSWASSGGLTAVVVVASRFVDTVVVTWGCVLVGGRGGGVDGAAASFAPVAAGGGGLGTDGGAASLDLGAFEFFGLGRSLVWIKGKVMRSPKEEYGALNGSVDRRTAGFFFWLLALSWD